MTLLLNAEKTYGLTEGFSIQYNSFDIGEVSEFFIEKDGTITVICKIKEEVKIPSDSKFTLVSTGLGNDKKIKIEFGKSETYLISGNKCKLLSEEENLGDSLKIKVNDILENLKGAKQDFILKELQKLNENVEELTRSQK